MQYGCIGEHLTHSFSREIHAALTDYQYELKEIPMGELPAFMTARDFKAINVTIPYKQDVIPFLKEVNDTAAMIGAVNTIVNKNGELYGYNTDFGGMSALIKRAKIDLFGKKVLILGTGGTSNTAAAVAKHMGAAVVFKVSRSEKTSVLTYDAVKAYHTDADILINTTPCGMFSREQGMPIDPALFPHLSGVVDAIYNPLRTAFVLKARSLGVPAAGGLYMLVMQAVLASEIFIDTKYPDDIAETVYRKVKASKENIVLTGMPGSGKSTVGKLLAAKLGRPFIDTDEEIEKETGATPSQIFATRGEPAFRDIETAVIKKLAHQNGAVIATGGGAILRSENVDALRMNGRLFFLNRPVEQLIPTADRPTASTRDAIAKRFSERFAIYLSTADTAIPGDGTPEEVAALVERSFLA